MRASSTKKYYTGVILFVLVMLMQYQSGFSTEKSTDMPGPVIAGVVINSCIGSITISVTSGVAPYTYLWKDGGGNTLPENSFVITGLGPDNYTVTITDALGDDITATYTVTNPPDLVGTVVVNEVTCRGDSDAQVVVTMANGNPGYDWELFNSGGGSIQTGAINFPQNVITIGGLGVDSYTLEVTDQDGCTGTITFVVTQPAQFLGSNLINQTNATCSDLANGSLEVVGTGGWGGYVYAWFDSGNNLIGTSGTINGLLPGIYTLRITDANGCQVTSNYTITGPDPITATASITPATCNGDSDGAIDITPAGGNGTFTYLWSNGATSQDISGVLAGNYSVTITDVQGCTLVQNYVISEPDPLIINEDIRDVACFGDNTGRIRSNVSGGTAPYTYVWSNGRTGRNNNNIVAGSYSLTVTDANGCTTFESFTVSEPTQALAVDSFSETLPSCFGGTDGTLQANVIGGTAAYSYSWSNGGNTAMITGLSSGAYTVTVTDANGCSVVESFTLNDPVRISVTPTVTIPTCNGGTDGSITVAASNGSAPYTYNWNTGDTGPSINTLSAGTYTVTVTDNLGCSVVENIIMGEPSVIQPNATVNAISCNGLTDGSIFLAVTGGTAPYTYSWNTGAVTANISSLSAGTYTVTITDLNGCTEVESFTVIEPAPLVASYTKVDVLCKGNTTGSIDLTPSAGTAPYTYLWSTGATTQDVSSLAAGNYSVTIRDASNCTIVESITIDEPTDALTVVGTETHVTCNGSTNGSIDITVAGGVGPYTYSWNNGDITEDVTALAAGSYSVQVTDANGCVQNAGFTVTEPNPFLVTPTVNDVTCNAAGDGSISLAVSGGTAPYTYAWSDGSTIQNRSSLTPGNYTVTVTDANGCQNVQPLTITEPAVLGISYLQQNVACHGDNTGLINVTVTGGTAPYSYSWSNGAITEDLSNLVAGTYNLTVTDANGCVIPETVTISEPSAPLSFTSVVNQITCNAAADGQINLTVSGGTAPYTFNWSNGSTSEDLSALPAATYSVTITDSQGCTTAGAFNITDPPLLVVTGAESDISCHGAADGSIDLTVSGGEAPYTFIWAHGPTIEDVNSLGPGAYTVQVLDSRGCSSLAAFTITEPDALVLSTASTNVFCFGQTTGQIDLSVTGGTAPYFYSWSNGDTGEDLTGLAAGTYTVVVTDANGCIANESVTITQPAAALGLTEVITQVSCNGFSNGSIDITVTGGTAPYTYIWNDGFVSEDRNALAPGSYQVTISDVNGCQEIGNYTITEPDALASGFTSADISCFGAADGTIDITITGGTAPYTYSWADGPTTQDRSALGPGTYTLTTLDANGCAIVEVVTITEPAALTLAYATTDVLCFGNSTGAIDLTVSGGTAPFSYSWSSGETVEDLSSLVAGTYAVLVTDDNGCTANETITITEPAAALAVTDVLTQVTCNGLANGSIDLTITGGTAPYAFAWNDGQITEDRSALGSGTYSVTITDANGCQEAGTYNITEPTVLITTLTSSDVSCFGVGDGVINLAVSGGTSPYSFAWSDGSTNQDRNLLTPGGYSVTITDANGCQNTETVTITQPNELLLNHSVADVSCFGEATGSIDITITGGTAPYTYKWFNGSTGEDQLNLAAATYSVTVTDANGCMVNEDIVVSEPAAALAITGATTNETCAGFANGTIDINVTGGTAPYSYSWNTGATSEDIAGLLPGTYQVTVTDNLGCSTDQAYTITGPQPLSLTGTVTNLTCRNAADGRVDITVEGGTAPYTFAWSDGQTVEDAANLAAASYSVLITDANGCSLTETFTVTEPLELVANYLVSDVTCFGETDGSIDAAVSGGTAPYTYAWSNGETSQDLTNLTGGSYTLVVTDAQGCKVTAVITVEAPSAPLAATPLITDATCNGLPTGRIEMTVTGGTAPYSYAWSNGSSQKNLLNAFAGDYALTITDINGCQVQALYTIGEPGAITPDFDVVNTSCFGDTDGSITVTTTGGQAPYTYVWSNGSTSQDQFNLTGGTYNVTVTDANNCSVTQAVVVGDSRDLSVVVNKQDIACKGETNGAINLNVTGGSGSYTYLWNDGSTTRDLSGVAAGVYQVVISDAGGCATTATVVISEPALPLTASIDKSDDLSCFGSTSGFATAVPRGGIAPYTYLWSNGDRTATISQLTAGSYTVSVTDANGCIVQENFNIQQPEAPLNIMVTGTLNLACKDNEDGNIRLEVTGGTAPYSYLWSTGSTTDRISDLRAGDYTVRVVDALGCVKEKQITVAEPDELRIANARVNQSQCFDDRNGSIELEISGGTRPYSYQWNNQAITKNLIGISSGTYQVLVTDARGCQIEAIYKLAEPELFRLQPVVSEISCVGFDDASISLNIEGGVGQLAIQWNTGNVGETITNLKPGQYNVTVTDDNGCTLQQNFNIIEPLPVSLDAFVQDAVKCGDPRSGRINLIVSGGREPYTYRWSNGETTQSLVDILPGTYAVTVRDRYGCSATGTYSVQQPEPLRIGLRTDILINCETRTVDSRVTADVSGGFGGYQYEWSRGGSSSAENLVSEPGRLTLLITDDQGCTLTKSVDITIPELGEADFDFTSESIVRDGEAAANDPVSFFDDSFGDIVDWNWDFGDGFDSREVDPIHTYSAPGIYSVTLVITDGSGCTSTQVKVIEITEGYRIMVPDAFSPNNDGNNDFFRPRMLGLEKVQLMVFNTWGEVIFSTEDVDTPGWDGFINGKPAENGNYVYKLIGLSFNGLKVERDGVFALID